MSKNAKRELTKIQDNQAIVDRVIHQQNQVRIRELKATALAVEGSISLDDLIHDLKSQEASAINNGGADEQIDYIIEQFGEADGIRKIEEALNG